MNKKFLSLILVFCMVFCMSVPTLAQSASADPSIPDTFDPPATPVALEECDVSLSFDTCIYNAKKRTPKVTVLVDEQTALAAENFTVEYQNNLNVGTASVVITAKDTSSVVTGSVVKEFTITPRSLNSTYINAKLSKSTYIYSGKAHTPTVKFTSDVFGTLKKDVDYTVSYKNNTKPGYATLVATGKGNFGSTFKKTFKIKPAPVEKIIATKIKETTFRLSWTESEGASGYRLYRYNSEKKRYVYTGVQTKNTYYDVGGRDAGQTYFYKIRPYKTTSTDTIFADMDEYRRKVIMKPAQTVLKDSTYKNKNTFVFKWKKQKANGYEIQYSKDKKFDKKDKIFKINSGSITKKEIKLSKNKNRYFRVRAYRTLDNGSKRYGKWSEKQTTLYSTVYSSYSTTFSSPAGRTKNIKQACKYIDGTVLAPGETFSFNSVVGKRTIARGFAVATVYRGNKVEEGLGGGICQVSTTIFNAALLGNLSIVERNQHSLPVHYVAGGRDASVSWGTADFKFKNTSGSYMKISAKVIDNYKIEIKLLTSGITKPKKASLSVSSSYYDTYTNEDNEKVSRYRYVLTRSVGGKANYSTTSIY